MTAIQKLLSAAKAEVGYLEKASNSQLESKTANAGYNNWTKYADYLDKIHFYNGPKNSYAWCAAFVDYLFVKTFGLETALKMTGQVKGGYGAGCTESARYYKKIDRFFKTKPQPGDQIFFSNDSGKTMCHTGLVTAVDNKRVYTIEGNTSSTQGVVPNGGAVREKSYLLTYSRIGGYGRPKYELVEQEEDEDMTEQTFDKMMEGWMARKGIQPPTFEQEAINWASENGIMKGYSADQFAPKKPITRGEVIVVLKRFFDKYIKK